MSKIQLYTEEISVVLWKTGKQSMCNFSELLEVSSLLIDMYSLHSYVLADIHGYYIMATLNSAVMSMAVLVSNPHCIWPGF